jgi:hypothetical protein
MSGLTFSLLDSAVITKVVIGALIAQVLLFIPSLLVTGAKPEGVAKAIGGYLWKSIGLFLLAISSIQLMYSVVMTQLPNPELLSALLFLMVVGIGIMIHASRIIAEVDHASSAVPRLVFSHTCEFVGGTVALVSGLSLGISLLLTMEAPDWQMPATMILLGCILMLSSSLHISHKNKRAAASKRKR